MKRLFSAHFWQARDMELFLGKFLRFGVMLSCGITLLGGVLYLWQNEGDLSHYKPTDDFVGVAPQLRSLSSILEGIMQLDGAAIIQFGVIVLIATPVIRVAISAVAFLIEKDYMYVVITLVVLAIIVANMFLGFH